MNVLLVCGDREWKKVGIVRRVLEQIGVGPGWIVIEGDCRGADRIGGTVARTLGAHVEPFPADWPRYGRGAGPVRNEQMLQRLAALKAEGHAVRAVAFHPDLRRSKGTRDMVTRLENAGVPVTKVDGTNGEEKEEMTARQAQKQAYTAARQAGLDTNTADAVARSVGAAFQDGEIPTALALTARTAEEIQKHAAP